jgi:hypothetical protein
MNGGGDDFKLAGTPGTFPAAMLSTTDTTCRKNRSRDSPVTSGLDSSPHVALNRDRSASTATSPACRINFFKIDGETVYVIIVRGYKLSKVLPSSTGRLNLPVR